MDRALSIYDLEVALNMNLDDKSRLKMMVQFTCLKSDEERIGYVLKLLKDKNIATENNVSVGAKSLPKSIEVRNKGNEAYKRKNLLSALKFYTEAIALAPHPSVLNYSHDEVNEEIKTALSLAVGDRSALLFDLKKYNSCLKDISLALVMNYPQNLRHKLYTRQMQCLHALGRIKDVNDTLEIALESLSLSDDLDENNKKSLRHELENLVINDCSASNNEVSHSLPTEDIKITGKPSESLRGFTNCVKLNSVDDTGRGLFATKDIKIGDVIGIEKPFAAVLGEEYFYTNCHNCCQLCRTLIPCFHCSVAMFCSEECSKEAWEKYHSVECEILPMLLHAHIYTKRVALALRIVIIASNMFESLKDFSLLVKMFRNTCGNHFHSLSDSEDFKTISLSDQKEKLTDYFQIFKMPTYNSFRSAEELLFSTLYACSVVYFLERRSCYFLEYNGAQKVKLMCFIGSLLFRHINNFSHNVLSYTYHATRRDFDIIPVGIGMYPILSKINHSCDPNTFRFTHLGNKVVVCTLKDIKSGDEIFYSYGPLYYKDSHIERRNYLKRCYNITCQCIACTENWPTLKKLKKQTHRLKCQSCGSELPTVKHSPYVRKCSTCHQTNNVKQLIPKLKDEMNALAQKSMKGVLHFSEIIPVIKLVNNSVCKPSDFLAECEMLFKNHFNKMMCSDSY